MEYAGVVRPAFMEEPALGGVRTALAKPSGSSCGRKVRQKDEDDPWAFRVASTTKKITRPKVGHRDKVGHRHRRHHRRLCTNTVGI